MISLDLLKERLLPYVRSRQADKIGCAFLRTSLQVSRFAGSQVHQHLCDENQTIYFRVLLDGRLGVASTNSLSQHNLKEAFHKALHMSRLRLAVKGKKDIPCFSPLKYAPSFYFPGTAQLSPGSRIRLLKKIFSYGSSRGVTFSGHLHNGFTQIAVISPEGKINYQDYSFAGIKLIASSKGRSGYSQDTSYDISKIDLQEACQRAVNKCLAAGEKIILKPGRYDVILEPAAVAELIYWLNYTGFGAKNTLEETGLLYRNRGRRVSAANVTIYDWGSSPETFILPFDFEGVRREKTYLIKNGVAGSPLCDSYYGRLLGLKTTGHANLPDDTDGPLGYNLIMENSATPYKEMIEGAHRALLVSRFHYINGFLDTRKALMTGMTRDGTFVIREGKIKEAAEDLRFTDSILEAFSRISRISRERQLVCDHLESLGSVYAPSLYIKGFNFTS